MNRFVFSAIVLLSMGCACSSGRSGNSKAAEAIDRSVKESAEGQAVKHYTLKVVNSFDHDRSSYTQGLFFVGDELFESTGQYGESTFRKVDLQSGRALKKVAFEKKYFVEGSTEFDGKIYILTWQEGKVFIYDKDTFRQIDVRNYGREGWGLTTDGKQLIASDGSSYLYFLDSELRTKKKLKVTLAGNPVQMLNELEYIDGKIWANVYLRDSIMIIDPSTGKVEGVIDCKGLLPESLVRSDTDVLNGIAVRDGKIYLTGKNWPKLYQVELVEI